MKTRIVRLAWADLNSNKFLWEAYTTTRAGRYALHLKALYYVKMKFGRDRKMYRIDDTKLDQRKNQNIRGTLYIKEELLTESHYVSLRYTRDDWFSKFHSKDIARKTKNGPNARATIRPKAGREKRNFKRGTGNTNNGKRTQTIT